LSKEKPEKRKPVYQRRGRPGHQMERGIKDGFVWKGSVYAEPFGSWLWSRSLCFLFFRVRNDFPKIVIWISIKFLPKNKQFQTGKDFFARVIFYYS